MAAHETTASLMKQGNFLDDIKKTISNIGMSRLLISCFFILLLLVTKPQELPETFGNIFIRVGLNCVLVLSMVPSIKSGLGPNFGSPLGIIAGLLGALVVVEMKLAGLTGFMVALVLGIIIAIPCGIFYGVLMNKVKGSEMMISTYFGNAIVSIMCIGWLILPFKSPDSTWTMKANGGLRTTVSLDNYFGKVLNDILQINVEFSKNSTIELPIILTLVVAVIAIVAWFFFIKPREYDTEAATDVQLTELKELNKKNRTKGLSVIAAAVVFWLVVFFVRPASGIFASIRSLFVTTAEIPNATTLSVPTGMLVFSFLCCFIVWLFLNSKSGIAMSAVGANPECARASGIPVDKMRILGATISTVLAAVGILVYAQGFGFLQLYTAPMSMTFPPIAAILIGGASTKDAKISHAIMGVLLFQGIMTMGPPIAARFLSSMGGANDPSEVVRIIITNGVILYALTKAGGNSREK